MSQTPTCLYDKHLPFGARVSPRVFHRLKQMICCLMAQRGLYTALAYLDDVLIIGPTQTHCKVAFNTLLNLLVRVSQFHSQLDQSCLPCLMSDFSWS